MKKYLFLFLPVMAILLSACSNGYSLEYIYADYVTNKNQILSADGGIVTIKISSTHSYVMTSEPADAVEFSSNGVVKYSHEGVSVVDLDHDVLVSPNTSGKAREVRIFARQRHNQEIVTSLLFYQPAMENTDNPENPDEENNPGKEKE